MRYKIDSNNILKTFYSCSKVSDVKKRFTSQFDADQTAAGFLDQGLLITKYVSLIEASSGISISSIEVDE